MSKPAATASLARRHRSSIACSSPGPSVAGLWDRLVRRPCEEGLERVYPVLKRQERLGELFRYQDLGAVR